MREAECNGERFAIKIILKKNVKGNEKMVYDEMVLLQRMKHKNIVRFHDWFESKVKPHESPEEDCLLMLWIRTNIILSPSWPPAGSSSIGSANMASLRRRMLQKRSRRC